MPDTMAVDYTTSIPNNVGLSEDRRVLKALEKWHPGYLDWWKEMGPEGFQESLVYLRTAVGVETGGWAKFDYVKMPEYRWGIFLGDKEENRGGGSAQDKLDTIRAPLLLPLRLHYALEKIIPFFPIFPQVFTCFHPSGHFFVHDMPASAFLTTRFTTI